MRRWEGQADERGETRDQGILEALQGERPQLNGANLTLHSLAHSRSSGERKLFEKSRLKKKRTLTSLAGSLSRTLKQKQRTFRRTSKAKGSKPDFNSLDFLGVLYGFFIIPKV
ncbi:hypothetical protein BaRGS_00011510 [Batillaria attramentaria]|uniref:Uncharacterized protein n=1 Tax=Batillaria attramentaria TaxID=370345 RepID=A0ABD0LCK5_9CAEN